MDEKGRVLEAGPQSSQKPRHVWQQQAAHYNWNDEVKEGKLQAYSEDINIYVFPQILSFSLYFEPLYKM